MIFFPWPSWNQSPIALHLQGGLMTRLGAMTSVDRSHLRLAAACATLR